MKTEGSLREPRWTVGIFDSGIGGLSVLSACRAAVPRARFLYLSDHFRAPYGELSSETIRRYVFEALAVFARAGADAAVLACNTATAAAASAARAAFSFPVVGLEPAVLPAARAGGRVLVLTTPRTAESTRLARLVAQAEARGCFVTVAPCPRLAGAIEAHLLFGEPLDFADHLPRGAFDGVVLGCTHYVLVGSHIAEFYRAPVYDGNEGTARRLAFLLSAQKTARGGKKTGRDDHLQNTENANKCSQTGENSTQKGAIFFLGSSKELNQRIFEQMFDPFFSKSTR